MPNYETDFSKQFISNMDYPVLIGFPYCGIELVAACLEIYLQTTGHPKSFFEQSHKENFWGLFANGLRYDYLKRKNLLFCYRKDPIPIIYGLISRQDREIDDHNVCILCSQYKDHKEIFLKHSSINFAYENFKSNIYQNTVKLSNVIKHCFSTKEEKWWELTPDSYIKFGEVSEEVFYERLEQTKDSLIEESVEVPESFINLYGEKIKMLTSLESENT